MGITARASLLGVFSLRVVWGVYVCLVCVFGDAMVCSISGVPYSDDSFDYVYSINVLEHAQPWQKLVLDMARVLRPGGLLYVQVLLLLPSTCV